MRIRHFFTRVWQIILPYSRRHIDHWKHVDRSMCAAILQFCDTCVSRNDHFAIQAYRMVSICRVHRWHKGRPSSALSGFYFYGFIPKIIIIQQQFWIYASHFIIKRATMYSYSKGLFVLGVQETGGTTIVIVRCF